MPKTNSPPQRYRAVIFDLDGTLLDTLADIAAAMNRVIESRGNPPFGIEEYKTLVGEGIDVLIRRALHPRPVDDAAVREIVLEFRDEYERCWRQNSRPYPGIRELLGTLAGRGVKLAVLSNKVHPFTERMIAELLPEFQFGAVRGAMPDVPLKPDPAAALLIAAELDVPAGDFAFLGDTRVDMETALAAGMFPVGALWGFRGAEELTASGAGRLISSPLELLEYL